MVCRVTDRKRELDQVPVVWTSARDTSPNQRPLNRKTVSKRVVLIGVLDQNPAIDEFLVHVRPTDLAFSCKGPLRRFWFAGRGAAATSAAYHGAVAPRSGARH